MAEKQKEEKIVFLNKNLEKFQIRPLTLAGLKAGGFKNFGELLSSIKALETQPTLGRRSRSEIRRLFKKAGIELPIRFLQ